MTDQQGVASRSNEATQAKKRSNGAKNRSLGRIVDRGTQTAERLHRAVASLPLDALEGIQRFEKPVARLRKLQDRSITATYEFVRGVTREVAKLVRDTSNNRHSRRQRGNRRRAATPKASKVDRSGGLATAS